MEVMGESLVLVFEDSDGRVYDGQLMFKSGGVDPGEGVIIRNGEWVVKLVF